MKTVTLRSEVVCFLVIHDTSFLRCLFLLLDLDIKVRNLVPQTCLEAVQGGFKLTRRGGSNQIVFLHDSGDLLLKITDSLGYGGTLLP